MITTTDWDRLKYKKPFLIDKKPKLSKIIGIDSEAYTSGEPFMFCTSLGDVLLPQDIPEIFFTPRYNHANFVIYNMKYDSGAILYHKPLEMLRELWSMNSSTLDGCRYQYIPHKMLRISRGKEETVTFWDISQFYKSSLDKAAKFYLKKGKIEMRTKNFSWKYVNRFWDSIAKYCIQDAVLTKELGEYFVDKLEEFGITASAIYSCASISFKYFCENSKISTSWPFWDKHQRLLQYACDAYEGGKFEVTARGAFHGYEYDITSAYPYEIAKLVDLSNANVSYGEQYRDDAVYGFLRCRIDNTQAKHIPCGMMEKNVRIYPAGVFHLTITKQEYDYLQKIGVSAQIIMGAWVHVDRIRYPYKQPIQDLFAIKAEYKGKDVMLTNTSKIVMNSFYGKLCQVIDDPFDNAIAGQGWNPMHAGVITANTRIKVTDLQNFLGEDCLAVHTDSVMVTHELPDTIIKKGLGEFDLEVGGDGVLIACGMYQINDTCAYKGFRARRGDTWRKMLAANGKKERFYYPALQVESWVEAMAKNHPRSAINLFARKKKMIDLNCDTKRVWTKPATGRSLLDGLEQSSHRAVFQMKRPKYWQKYP